MSKTIDCNACGDNKTEDNTSMTSAGQSDINIQILHELKNLSSRMSAMEKKVAKVENPVTESTNTGVAISTVASVDKVIPDGRVLSLGFHRWMDSMEARVDDRTQELQTMGSQELVRSGVESTASFQTMEDNKGHKDSSLDSEFVRSGVESTASFQTMEDNKGHKGSSLDSELVRSGPESIASSPTTEDNKGHKGSFDSELVRLGAESIAPSQTMEDNREHKDSSLDSEFAAPPPKNNKASPPAETPKNSKYRISDINEETAKKALLKEIDTHCCWRYYPPEELEILNLVSFSATHYMIDTLTEKRSTYWEEEPYYKGQQISSSRHEPSPWDVEVSPPMFRDETRKMEVPDTAYKKSCHSCYGGTRWCDDCNRSGWHDCSCNDNTDSPSTCRSCEGGRIKCTNCDGKGEYRCHTCNGKGKLRHYMVLVVEWTNHYDDKVLDGSRLSARELRQVAGEKAFYEKSPRLRALTSFPDQRVNRVSKQLVQMHNQAYSNIVMQQHKVRMIPITEVTYKHGDHHGCDLVYGFENQAYIAYYPSCCNCCIIL